MKIDNSRGYSREVLIRIAKLFFADKIEDIYKIPFEMKPKDIDPAQILRCCIHKERAILRARIIASLGFRLEDDNEIDLLPSFARRAMAREKPTDDTILTVLDIACHGCVKSRYVVTELCQGCLARPCVNNCPFHASTIVNGKSYIDPDKCRSCGKCMAVCPYHAIVYQPVPCEASCPVGAIHKNDKSGRACIDKEKCIRCGNCERACPFAAVMELSQVIDVLKAIRAENKKVVAMVAPAILGQFNAPITKVYGAIKTLGFDDVVEVASGADETTEKEAAEFVERMKNGEKVMTTSCCSAYYQIVEKHIPELKPFVSSTRTPMHYTAKAVKANDPKTVTVFIGPCIAKRYEAFHDEYTDLVITFEELDAMFAAKNIDLNTVEDFTVAKKSSAQGRNFAVAGGVAAAVEHLAGDKVPYKPVCITGVTSKDLRILKDIAKGRCDGNMVEVMICQGGCCNGASACADERICAKEVKNYATEGFNLKDKKS